ncbi:MAG: iron-containing alcohol dehydrogenase [Clostridia bacterium]|nr:iron-containing alcohol dehydrogenase [Clostridia bacterium]
MSNIGKRVFCYQNLGCEALVGDSGFGELCKKEQRENKIKFFCEIHNTLKQFGQKVLILFSRESYAEYGMTITEFFKKRYKFAFAVAGNFNDDAIKTAMAENDDARVILAVGGGQTVNMAKLVARERGLPIIALLTQPDSDSLLTDTAQRLENGRITSIRCPVPQVVFFDKGARLTPRQIKCAVGIIAKNVLSVFELKYLSYGRNAIADSLQAQIKNCVLEDFGSDAETNYLLYKTLCMLSLIRNKHPTRLFFAVDAIIATANEVISPTMYYYPLSCFVTSLYQDILSETYLNFTLPLNVLNGYNSLISCGFDGSVAVNATKRMSEYQFTPPSLTTNLNSLALALNLFEPHCINSRIPLNKQELLDYTISALLMFCPNCLLNDLYLGGYLG